MAITLHILKEQNEDKTYKVVAGDTMWDISKKYKVDIEQLKAANPQIKNINLIYPGDIINIPSSGDPGGSTNKQKSDSVLSMEPLKITAGEEKDFKYKVDELAGHILASKAFSHIQPPKKVDDPDAKIIPIGAQRYKKATDKAISIANELRLKVDQDLVSDEDKKYFFTSVAKAFALTKEGIYPKISTGGSAIEIYLSIRPNTMIAGIPWSSRHWPAEGKISREEFEKMYENLLLVQNFYSEFGPEKFIPGGSSIRRPVAPAAPLPRTDF